MGSNDIGMKFGVENCAILTMKKRKMANSDGITVPNKTMKGLKTVTVISISSNTGRWSKLDKEIDR